MHLLESGLEVEYRKIAVEDLADATTESIRHRDLHGIAGTRSRSIQYRTSLPRLVGSGGRCFFSTINRNPKSYLFAVLGAEYFLNLLPKGTHDYSRFIKPAELARICRKAGILPDHLTGMTYNPFTGIYALASDASVNYILGTKAA